MEWDVEPRHILQQIRRGKMPVGRHCEHELTEMALFIPMPVFERIGGLQKIMDLACDAYEAAFNQKKAVVIVWSRSVSFMLPPSPHGPLADPRLDRFKQLIQDASKEA